MIEQQRTTMMVMTTVVHLTNAVSCLLVCLPDAVLGVGNQQRTGKVPILGIFVFLAVRT